MKTDAIYITDLHINNIKMGTWNGLFQETLEWSTKKRVFLPPPPPKKKILIKTGRCNFCYCKIPPRCPENIPHKPFIISYIQIRKILRKNILENSYNYNKHVNLMLTSENVTTG